MTEQVGLTTTHTPVYPGYTNLQRDGKGYRLTCRGEPRVENGITFGCGATVSLFLTDQEALRFLTEARDMVLANCGTS